MKMIARSSRAYGIAFGALLLFHVAMNCWWVIEDNHPIRTDEESHMLAARAYYNVLFVQHHDSLFQKLVAVSQIPPSEPAHPPLLHFLGAVLMKVLGYGVDVMSFLNTFSFVAVLIGSLKILRRFLPPWEALYGVFVISFTPIIFAASRYFMTDYLSLALVVWAFYALLRCEGFLNTPWVFLFAVLNGLGIMARTTSFLYYLLPCAVIALGGLRRAFWPQSGESWINPRLRLWTLNTLLTLVVSVGIFSPWYLKHLDEYYDYWLNRHNGGLGGPVALFQPDTRGLPRGTDLSAVEKTEAEKHPAPQKSPAAKTESGRAGPSVPAVPAPPVSPATPPPKPLKRLGFLGQLLHPRLAWSVYPEYVCRDVVFLPTFLLAILGMVLALFCARFRRGDLMMIFLWVAGSWAIMTIVMKYATPRYALQATPPLSIFAAVAVLAPRRPRFRYMAMGVFAALLLFQYGNLTISAYGPIKQFGFYKNPLSSDPRHYRPPDYVIYKDELTLGFSYTSLCAPVRENFKDKVFMALLRAESERISPKGEYANYLSLNLRGTALEAEHYWPDSPNAPNPYKKRGIPEKLTPKRKLLCVGMGKAPEELVSKIDSVDYIVYALDSYDTATEQRWIKAFERYNFFPFDRFQEKRFGEVPDQTYGVLARRSKAGPISIKSTADIDRLTLLQLYQFRNTVGLSAQYPELKTYADKRLEKMINESDARPYQVNDSLTFISASASRQEGNWFLFRFIFKVNAPLSQDYRIYFHGRVEPENVKLLPKECQKEGYGMWNFNPDPPTHNWPVNDYVILTHRIQTEAILYKLKLGFMQEGGTFFGASIPLGEIDFGKVPASDTSPRSSK